MSFGVGIKLSKYVAVVSLCFSYFCKYHLCSLYSLN